MRSVGSLEDRRPSRGGNFQEGRVGEWLFLLGHVVRGRGNRATGGATGRWDIEASSIRNWGKLKRAEKVDRFIKGVD